MMNIVTRLHLIHHAIVISVCTSFILALWLPDFDHLQFRRKAVLLRSNHCIASKVFIILKYEMHYIPFTRALGDSNRGPHACEWGPEYLYDVGH